MQGAQIFFYISAGLAVWITVIGLLVIIVEVVQMLRMLKKIMANVQSGIADLDALKSGIKLGVLSMVSNVIGSRKSRGGEEK